MTTTRPDVRPRRALTATWATLVVAGPLGVVALFVARFAALGPRGGMSRTEARYDLAICLVAVGAPALAATLAWFDRRRIVAAVLAVVALALAVVGATWAQAFGHYLRP